MRPTVALTTKELQLFRDGPPLSGRAPRRAQAHPVLEPRHRTAGQQQQVPAAGLWVWGCGSGVGSCTVLLCCAMVVLCTVQSSFVVLWLSCGCIVLCFLCNVRLCCVVCCCVVCCCVVFCCVLCCCVVLCVVVLCVVVYCTVVLCVVVYSTVVLCVVVYVCVCRTCVALL